MTPNAADTEPLVSIVTPTLNQASFIEATIRSVMRQTYPRLQHIVIDGGSTDGTLDVLARYQGRYDLTFASGKDTGMYEAINRGMAMAQGDVLCYLNSDDLYLPWTLETVVAHLRQQPSADVVFGDALLLDDATRRVRIAFYPPFTRAFVLRAGSLLQPTVFWRRSAFESVGGFNQNLRFVGDLDYWIRLGERCRFLKIDEILAVERGHLAAKTTAFNADLLREAEAVRARHERAGAAAVRLSALAERVRGWLWRRRYWGRVLANSDRALPDGGWAAFLRGAEPRFSAWRVVLLQLPLVGWRFASDAVVPTRGWIDELIGPNDVR